MLSQICLYLNNWFDFGQSKYFGTFTISEGAFDLLSEIQTNQYYRIVGSVFNDGVHKRGSEELIDETFEGAIWLMAVPKDVIDLTAEITAWQAKYGDTDSMTPYQSESFGGYSYTKSSSGSSGSSTPTWMSVFADRLRRYKKL